MQVFVIIADAVVFLLILLLLLSFGLVLLNGLSLHRQKDFQKKRAHLNKVITDYLDKKVSAKMASKEIKRDKGLLLGIVSQIAQGADVAKRAQLIQFFDDFDLAGVPQEQLANLTGKDFVLRQRAAIFLPYIAKPERITQPLIHALQDEMLDVRLAAARSLGVLKCSDAISVIIENLALSASWPIQRVIEVLQQMGPDSTENLIAYLGSPVANDAGRVIAIAVLGMQKDSRAIPIITEMLRQSSLEVRIQCVKALGAISDKQATETLCAAMKDDSWELRSACANSLGLLKDESAIEALSLGLKDANWWVRLNSANALYAIGGTGIEALKLCLDNEDRFARDVSRLVLDEKGIAL